MSDLARAAAPEARPDRRPTTAAEPRLRVVGRQALLRRARRRRARVTLGLSACVVAAALMLVAAAGSVVLSEQLRLDSVHAQVATALAQEQSLQVQRATLESPSRILAIAEKQLHMVAPTSVHYLVPGTAGGQSSTQTTQTTQSTGGSSSTSTRSPSSGASPRR
jgi:cell division protein FtsL